MTRKDTYMYYGGDRGLSVSLSDMLEQIEKKIQVCLTVWMTCECISQSVSWEFSEIGNIHFNTFD